jgi:glycosyltransferase involved in cell wall biosynthesis
LSDPPTTLLFLIDAWNNGTGGIQTVNRNLCSALAAVSRVHDLLINVVCLATECTDEDIAQALLQGVTLQRADDVSSESNDNRIIATMMHSSLTSLQNVACVVGHSKFTGKAARWARDNYFANAKVVTVYHMDPDLTETWKEGQPSSEDRVMIERQVALGADIIFAVGPLLSIRLNQLLFGQPGKQPRVETLLCGINDQIKPRNTPPPVPNFLFVGRVEHPRIKGIDLFAKAAGRLIKRLKDERDPKTDPTFVIRGFPNDEKRASEIYQELCEQARAEANHEVTFIRRNFTPDEQKISEDIQSASVLVMPSRAEGFGLVALEAISHGVPIIVAEDSGVAELIKSIAMPGFKADFIIDTRDEANEAIESLARAMYLFVHMPNRGKMIAESLLERLSPKCSWNESARTFLRTVLENSEMRSSTDRTVLSDIVQLLKAEDNFVNNECRRTTGKDLASIFVPRDLAAVRQAYSSQSLSPEESALVDDSQSWSSVITPGSSAIILGTPGIGKTIALLREVSARCRRPCATGDNSTALAPAFYFHANQIAGHLVRSNRGLLESIVSLVESRHGPMSMALKSWLHNCFRTGQLLLVVDGLDEVAPAREDKQDRRSILLEQLAAAANVEKCCSIVLSSRISGYSGNPLVAAREWQLVPFTFPKITLATKNWLRLFPDAADEICAYINRTPPLAEVFANPLLLMLACSLWEQALRGGNLMPRFFRRRDLFENFRGSLYRRWIERLTQRGSPPTNILSEAFADFVVSFAWNLWRGDPRKTTFSRAEVIKIIESVAKPQELQRRPDLLADLCEAGILTKSNLYDNDAPYLFLHRSILEYLAACHIGHNANQAVALTRPYFNNPDSGNVLWMLAGILKDPNDLLGDLVNWAETQLVKSGTEISSMQSPILADLITNCFFEARTHDLPSSLRQRGWEIITRGLDRKQRRQRRERGEWMTIADWSLIFRALTAVETHEGPRSYGGRVLDLIRDIRSANSDQTRGFFWALHRWPGKFCPTLCKIVHRSYVGRQFGQVLRLLLMA